MTLSQNRL